MKYVNFVHDPEKQYRSTVPAVRPLSTGLQVTEQEHAVDLELTGVCIMIFYYTGQIVTFQLRRARPQRPSHPLCLSPLRVLYMRWVGEGMHCQGELVKR